MATIQIAMKADQMRSDLVRGLVWFVNYAAIDPESVTSKDLDLHGAAMLPEDVELFAHRWLSHSRSVDINHDGIGRPVYTAESFFNGPDIASPAWPVNSHAVRLDVRNSKEALDGLKDGTLNSVSLDAYTFNQVVRLPVAEAKAAGLPVDGWVEPSTAAEWAEEIARLGYHGVDEVVQFAPGLFVATRSAGMPVAIHIDRSAGYIEASAAGGAWAHLGIALCESGTLTHTRKLLTPVAGAGGGVIKQPVDFMVWNQETVMDLLAERGIFLDQPADEAFAEQTDELFAFKDTTTQQSFLPHHTFHGDQMMVSRDGVIQAMTRLDEVPDHGRDAAREHLLCHLRQLSEPNRPVEAAA